MAELTSGTVQAHGLRFHFLEMGQGALANAAKPRAPFRARLCLVRSHPFVFPVAVDYSPLCCNSFATNPVHPV